MRTPRDARKDAILTAAEMGARWATQIMEIAHQLDLHPVDAEDIIRQNKGKQAENND